MELFNVRYYVTFTERATSAARIHPEYTEIAQASPWTIFQLPASSLVDVAEFMPSVYEPTDEVGVVERVGLILRENEELDDFFSGAVEWHAQVETLDHWLVESGPSDWPRTQAGFGGLSASAPTGGLNPLEYRSSGGLSARCTRSCPGSSSAC